MATPKTFNPSYFASKAWQDFVTAKLLLFSVPHNRHGIMVRPFSLPDFIRSVVTLPTDNHLSLGNLSRKKTRIRRRRSWFYPTMQKARRENSGYVIPKHSFTKGCRLPNSDRIRIRSVTNEGIIKPFPVPEIILLETNAAGEDHLSPAYTAGMYVLRRFGLF
ncbi:MAG: hypothetical protein AVDCRST_MAG96-2449 [uncultured Segetibacter sp.]|uniref:Uncharacterized protein n=1 Tax=uncultured Segetibacter sp. TaxID=481133 RepID=A0A6J4T0X7_9BACT|nr:MAG: hypothetical protein AVDCRST_MAG96-2449 [uncultured Segetibacter sp.]